MKQTNIINHVVSSFGERLKSGIARIIPVLALVSTLLAAGQAQAAPYASSLTNASGVISFRLNEAAQSVAIIFTNSGGLTVVSNIGARPLGLTVTNLFVPAANHFIVSVTNLANPGYVSGLTQQLTADGTNGTATNTLRFLAPRGIAINKNPASPAFGRIYVANAVGGPTTTGVPARTMGDGIFVLNADYSDAFGQGTNARTAGITAFTNAVFGSTDDGNTPWKLEIGEDNNLYIADFSISNGCIFVTDPSVTTGTNVIVGFGAASLGAANPAPDHGRIASSIIAKGSLATSNLVLYAIDSDTAGVDGRKNHIMKWDVGAGPLPKDFMYTNVISVTNEDLSITYTTNSASYVTNQETATSEILLNIAGVTVDLASGPDGKFYMLQNRSAGGEGGIFVINTNDAGSSFSAGGDGFWDQVYDSRADTIGNYNGGNPTPDFLLQSRAVAISPDGKFMGIIRDDNQIWVIQLVNGLPDLSTRKLVATTNNVSIGRDIAFDAANNLYTVSSGQQVMRVYSPGYRTIAQTASQGTFFFTNFLPNVTVTVTGSVTNAAEPSSNGQFVFSRTGDTTQPLTVNYTISGTATRGLDYQTNGAGGTAVINGIINFPAGVTSTNVDIVVIDDVFGEGTETVVFTLSASTNYISGGTTTATVFIADDGDLPLVSISTRGLGFYESLPGRPGKFNLTIPVPFASDLVVTCAVSGGVTAGVDYVGLAVFTNIIPVGQTNIIGTITPINNTNIAPDKTVIITVINGPGSYFTNGAAFSITNTLRNDDLKPGPTLFADNFDTDTTASWTVKQSLASGCDAVFNYDYSLDGVPPAPNSTNGTTRGLRMRANLGATLAQGISASPTGLLLTNDYRLRFDLWMNYNGPLAAGGAGSSQFFTVGVGVSENRTNVTLVATDARPGPSVMFSASCDGGFAEATGDYGVHTNGARIAASGTSIYPAGARDNFNAYYAEFGDLFAPSNQVASYPNQSGLSIAGSVGFAWHDVIVTKEGTNYTWIIDGLRIATIGYAPSTIGSNFSLGQQDLTLSVADNLAMNFSLFDNVRVERLFSTNALLTGLSITPGTIAPAFASSNNAYGATNAFTANPVTVTATAANALASLRVSLNGGGLIPITNGVASLPQSLSLNPPTNTLSVRVVSEDGSNTNFYSVNVLLLPSQTIPVLTNSYNGSQLSLSWPSSHVGYRLLVQTNSLSSGLGTNWFTVAGSSVTNQVVIPVSPANPTVFYRLVYP